MSYKSDIIVKLNPNTSDNCIHLPRIKISLENNVTYPTG